ncbi:CotH kinase family protein [Streptomyces sp. NPDC090106]|uniref:CotH kinase family protein n=1 Tax=Streptomyces sp. NPDC090106 TaxID=3365946 RepID=UPI0038033E87
MRLRDRIPVRLRHHWKPAGALCAGLAVMVWFFGDARISPYVTSDSVVEADVITENVRGSVGLYDTSVAHSVQLDFKQTDFTKMMKEFRDDGTKDYIQADLTIDGVYLENVGIRLKGNSTLMSLRGTGTGGGAGGGRTLPEGAAQGAPQGADGGGTGGGRADGDGQAAEGGAGGAGTGGGGAGGAGGGGMGGMTQYNLSEDKPQELPWLIKVDEYVEGRAYQGEREISLRPGSDSQVPLNEALSLDLTDATGAQAERYAFTSVQVNNGTAATRLMVENPDTEYAEAVEDGNGVLYKARAGGSFDYVGDDPSDYKDSFKQLNKVGSQDLEPVMKLIKWVSQASDEEFERDLGQYVDVESLAHYAAAQNLLMNFDDMAGPGKNYLLWYDLGTKKFSVLGWDYNLTFSGDATAGPDDSFSMGGGGGGAGGGFGDGGAQDGATTGGAGQAMPSGMPSGMPEGMPSGMPEGMPGGATGGDQGDGEAGGGGGFGGMSGHALKSRFLESDAFDSVYKKAYSELYETFFGSGAALKSLDGIADQAAAAGADGEALDSAVKTLRTTVTERTEALAEDEEVTG